MKKIKNLTRVGISTPKLEKYRKPFDKDNTVSVYFERVTNSLVEPFNTANPNSIGIFRFLWKINKYLRIKEINIISFDTNSKFPRVRISEKKVPDIFSKFRDDKYILSFLESGALYLWKSLASLCKEKHFSQDCRPFGFELRVEKQATMTGLFLAGRKLKIGNWKLKMALCFFILTFLVPTASATKWVTDITECGTAYMSIDCEADQYVCGFDGIMHCTTPKEAEQAKEKTETAFNLNSGLPSGLVLDCHSESASCLPWKCQTDTTCDTANQNTECLKAGGFKCGECKAGYLDCDTEAGCETADGSESGPHARYQGCKGSVCDAGYLDCDGKSTNGCEIEIGGACTKDGQTGNYSKTCIGNQPPNCSVFAQQFATVQTSSGETVASQLQIDEQGNINIPVDAKFMVGGVALGTDETKTCEEKQIKLGTQCLDIPSCEFLTFNGNTFTCADKPVAPVSETQDCKSGEIKIGTNCQVIPTCDFLRFDGKNGKFLCAQPTNSSPTQSPMIDNSQIETLVNTKFVQLASKLETDFTQMLTSIHQEVSAGLKTGKIVAVAPEMPSAKTNLDEAEPSFFSTIADFFSQLFK